MAKSVKAQEKMRSRVLQVMQDLNSATELLKKLQEKCAHGKVVATHYPGDCNDSSNAGICLVCGLEEHSDIDASLTELPKESTRWVSIEAFHSRYKGRGMLVLLREMNSAKRK